MSDEGKTAAQLEAEVDAQRRRLENRVTEIQDRMSPGQLLDEFLGYANASGTPAFLTNLGRTVQDNPMPVALAGIGIAWLMARNVLPQTPSPGAGWGSRPSAPGTGSSYGSSSPSYASDTSPSYAKVAGSALRRTRMFTDEAGQRYAEFSDEAGSRFRALTDEVGNRAGHFSDEAGATFHGFVDSAGDRISTFMDEAGERLADTQNWANSAFRMAGDRLGGLQDAVAQGADGLRNRVSDAANQMQNGTGALNRTVSDLLRDQPLIGGALAFAAGAALAALIPPTEQEDALMGASADAVKAQGLAAAGDAYERGKEQVTQTYGQLRDKAQESLSGLAETATGGLSDEATATDESAAEDDTADANLGGSDTTRPSPAEPASRLSV